jgi:hypothetical protein
VTSADGVKALALAAHVLGPQIHEVTACLQEPDERGLRGSLVPPEGLLFHRVR